jgi:hypothetical protein
MQDRQRLTTTGRAQYLAFSFKALVPLLGRVPSSASRGEPCLTDSHHVLEADHLGCQSLDLGWGLRLAVGRFLFEPLGTSNSPRRHRTSASAASSRQRSAAPSTHVW